jgi:hypothetical protein
MMMPSITMRKIPKKATKLIGSQSRKSDVTNVKLSKSPKKTAKSVELSSQGTSVRYAYSSTTIGRIKRFFIAMTAEYVYRVEEKIIFTAKHVSVAFLNKLHPKETIHALLEC